MTFIRLAPEQFDTIPDIAEPAENPVLVGHDEAATQLATAYRSGKLHHALLLAGPPGIGKATLAFHIAHHLLANPDASAAPETLQPMDAASPLFRQVAQGSHPAVLHLTRPMNDKTKAFKSVVTVDEIRKITRFLSMTSHDGAYRIAIIDPADDMNISAANALLKNLEEPPPRTLFILIAHSLGSLLPTIRSRCQLIKLKPLDDTALVNVLANLDAEMPDDGGQRAELARRAGGSVRDALLMTQFGGLDITDAMTQVVIAGRFDVQQAWRVAEAVSGRDATIQFDIFNQAALDMIAGWAREAATAGQLDAAATHADLWREADRLVNETNTYNLDKKQHVNGMLRRMWQALVG